MRQELNGKYKFNLANLTCANCASQIEETLQKKDEVEKALLSFATGTLTLVPHASYVVDKPSRSEVGEALTRLIQELCDSIEDGVIVTYDGDSFGTTNKKNKQVLYSFMEAGIALVILLLVSLTDMKAPPYGNYITIIAFIGVGRYVFSAALKNIAKGRFMDENFLIAVATLGALAIGEYHEALGVMIFYRIGVLFEEKATERSRSEIMSLIDMRPETVTVVDEGGFKKTIRAIEAQVGQIVQVRAGDRIPLDGTIVKGTGRIDTSPVTGEAKPLSVAEGSSVISGCINLSSTLHMRIDHPLEESFVTKILSAVEMATANKPSVDRFITRFATYYTPAVLLITALTIFIPSIMTGNWNYWIYTGLTFLVISCPCALVLSVPLAFFAGIGGSSKQGILFKGGLSMEKMKDIKVIAMDKTGTLTEGVFAVQDLVVAEGFTRDEVLCFAASMEELSSHPIAVSIREKAKLLHLHTVSPSDGEEFAGEGLIGTVNGKKILCGNGRLFERMGIAIADREILLSGATKVFVAVDGRYAGCIVIRDMLKADAAQSVAALQKQGYVVAMVTGDTKESAEAIGKEAQIEHIFAGLMPTEKLDTLYKLRNQYGPVMFVGDGINDAPVLAGAHIGCAMGSGADAALEAADVVFMNSEVGAVGTSIGMSGKTMTVAWQNVCMAIVIKLVVMIAGFIGSASLWLAIFADTGVLVICVLNAIRLLYVTSKKKEALLYKKS